MTTIAFIGLGHMGGPMAKNLLKAGHQVIGFDPMPAAQADLIQAGGKIASSILEAVSEVEVVISMLPAGEHVRQVYLGEQGIIAKVKAGTVLIDSSTIDLETSRLVNKLATEKGLFMVDAPVSGGTVGAQAGTLTFMVGGSEAAFAKAKPILESMGKNIIHAGAAGSGQAVKLCNNMVLGISMVAVAEACNLAEKAGLDPKVFYDICSTSTAQCWALNTNFPVPGVVLTNPASRDFQPGFMASMMLKDLRLAQQVAQQLNVATPLGSEATSLYTQLCDNGKAQLDFSAIVKLLEGKTHEQ